MDTTSIGIESVFIAKSKRLSELKRLIVIGGIVTIPVSHTEKTNSATVI